MSNFPVVNIMSVNALYSLPSRAIIIASSIDESTERDEWDKIRVELVAIWLQAVKVLAKSLVCHFSARIRDRISNGNGWIRGAPFQNRF